MPVDYEKLRAKKAKPKAIDPVDIFRRLPKPPGINDLYTSQAQVLEAWFARRAERDVVIKLHTGGGKTLVGLLVAQSTLNEGGEPVLYLVPTVQLVNQTLRKAAEYGISAVPYETGSGVPLADDFVNGSAVMIGTYKALFNGRSKFGLRGSASPQRAGAVILDDAHVAFSVIRESFTLSVRAEDDRERFESLTGLFRGSFRDADRLGTFDDIVSGQEQGVIEVPYWAWHEQLDAVRAQLKGDADSHGLVWPLLRDRLHLCHALISREAFTITPLLPLVDVFPTFAEAPRRIYMSATIADDSEIVRTFDADPELVAKPIASRSLAGVSERMVLIPDLMPFKFNVQDAVKKLLPWVSGQEMGSVVLVPSKKAAEVWADMAEVATGAKEVDALVEKLQTRATFGPAVFANRYDGIDLPGDACRFLVMYGLPRGTSDYELFRASALYGGATITRMFAQRIEQGIGRGARGAGDHCVVVLAGADLASWIATEANFRFLTSATRAQIEMGSVVSKEVEDLKNLAKTVKQSLDRDHRWTEYHAEMLAELVADDVADETRLTQAAGERKAFNLWRDGYFDKAVARVEKLVASSKGLDPQTRGWMHQLAARIADNWGHGDRAQDLQRQAYGDNRNLARPKVRPPYQPLPVPGHQARAIASQLAGYRLRRGFLQTFENAVVQLVPDSSANQFERALAEFATMLGYRAERHDDHGEGPDVLWLLPTKLAFVIEAKSRKKFKNALTKEDHGQLLVAAEWFESHYGGYTHERVSVLPRAVATRAAEAGSSKALTYDKLAAMVSDARALFTALCESQLDGEELVAECSRLLARSSLAPERIVGAYLQRFAEVPL